MQVCELGAEAPTDVYERHARVSRPARVGRVGAFHVVSFRVGPDVLRLCLLDGGACVAHAVLVADALVPGVHTLRGASAADGREGLDVRLVRFAMHELGLTLLSGVRQDPSEAMVWYRLMQDGSVRVRAVDVDSGNLHRVAWYNGFAYADDEPLWDSARFVLRAESALPAPPRPAGVAALASRAVGWLLGAPSAAAAR